MGEIAATAHVLADQRDHLVQVIEESRRKMMEKEKKEKAIIGGFIVGVAILAAMSLIQSKLR